MKNITILMIVMLVFVGCAAASEDTNTVDSGDRNNVGQNTGGDSSSAGGNNPSAGGGNTSSGGTTNNHIDNCQLTSNSCSEFALCISNGLSNKACGSFTNANGSVYECNLCNETESCGAPVWDSSLPNCRSESCEIEKYITGNDITNKFVNIDNVCGTECVEVPAQDYPPVPCEDDKRHFYCNQEPSNESCLHLESPQYGFDHKIWCCDAGSYQFVGW